MLGLRKRFHKLFHPRVEARAAKMVDAVQHYARSISDNSFAGNAEGKRIVDLLRDVSADSYLLHSQRLQIVMKAYGELPDGDFKTNLMNIMSDAKDGRSYGHTQLRPVDFKSLSWFPAGGNPALVPNT